MTRRLLGAAFALVCALAATPAYARHHHHYKHHHIARIRMVEVAQCVPDNNGRIVCTGAVQAAHGHYYGSSRVAGSRPSGCPHAWCGCGTSLRVFGRIIPELNLAANWRRFPSAIAASGMVAWRWGHVFYIESVNSDGTVVAYDPNSGGHVAHVHTISLRGFHVVDPHGSRMAMR